MMEVRADVLEPGDVVAVGDRLLEVVVVWNRQSIDGMVRVVLVDESRHTCAPAELWEVARG